MEGLLTYGAPKLKWKVPKVVNESFSGSKKGERLLVYTVTLCSRLKFS